MIEVSNVISSYLADQVIQIKAWLTELVLRLEVILG